MTTIIELPEEVIAQIAAGEIIERPAYALKELIENAIDAKATQIRIELTESGLSQMIVRDDGTGMSPENIEVSWKLHTTSKITSIQDLGNIRTQGFRGEALASIAAVSSLTIQSRTEDSDVGFYIQIDDQLVTKRGSVGIPKGTHIIVDSLFKNVPARQKFVQRSQTELRTCIQVVTSLAVANPSIRFILFHNKKILLDLQKAETFKDRLQDLFEEEVSGNLFPLQLQTSYVSIDGFIAHPSQTTLLPNKQYILVNNRPISSKLLSQAVKDALKETIPKDRNAIFFLSLSIPPELVDINIHPRKELVRFSSDEMVYDAVHTAVLESFSRFDITFQSSLTDTKTFGNISQSVAGKLLKSAVLKEETKPPSDQLILQLHNTYLFVQTTDGVLMIDQHAAHERILYEQFSLEFEKQKTQSALLPKPRKIALSNDDLLLLQEHLSIFKQLGFSFSFEKKRITIHQVPMLLLDRDPVPIIEELLADLQSGFPIRKTDTITHKMLTYLACRSAVKAGDILSQEKMREIITTLFTTKNQFTCPHGRPTQIHVPLDNLHVLFKRK